MLEEIALKKKIFDLEELKYLGILFLLVLIAFKIAFFKENLIVLVRSVVSIFWLFVIPGYFIMLYWKEKIGFIERIVVGMGMAAAIIGILSYYLSLAGLNLRFHFILLPLLSIILGSIFSLKRKE